MALMVCRCYPEIKDHFKTALSKIGICSPLWALRLEIPIFFHNPCTHPSLYLSTLSVLTPVAAVLVTCLLPFLSGSVGKLIIHPAQGQHGGLGKWRLLPCLGSCSCLGLVECEAERKWPSHLTVLQPL